MTLQKQPPVTPRDSAKNRDHRESEQYDVNAKQPREWAFGWGTLLLALGPSALADIAVGARVRRLARGALRLLPTPQRYCSSTSRNTTA